MVYRLRRDESLSRGLKRVLLEELEQCLDWLTADGDAQPAPKASHDVRKSLKRMRSALWVVRGAVGPRRFRVEWVAFRDAGRKLSGLRDAVVVADCYHRLRQQLLAAPKGPDPVAELLQREASSDDEVSPASDVMARLQAARRRIVQWELQPLGADDLWEAIRKIYRRGRRASRELQPGSAAESFHDWRKDAKHLYHQFLLVEGMRLNLLRPRVAAVDHLAEQLGREHDFSMLERRILALPKKVRAEATAVLAGALIERRKHQECALQAGQTVYTQKPGAFIEELDAYWKTWRSVRRAPPAGKT